MQTFNRDMLLSLLLILLMAGCAQSPKIKSVPETSADPLVAQARAMESTGDYLAAAALYESIAGSKTGLESQNLLLSAAENRLRALDIEGTSRLLSSIGTFGLPEPDFRRRLLAAELALIKNRPDEALDLLSAPVPMDMPVELLTRYHRARAKAFRLTGNLLESARELGELDFLLMNDSTRIENQLAIIQTYAPLSDTALQDLQPVPPGNQGGWMELTRIFKKYTGSQVDIVPLIAAWRQRFPTHPAMPQLLDSYFDRLKAQYRSINQVAVMLPDSGRYARVAAAIRDGILAAYYDQAQEERPRMIFYDSTDPDQTWPIYQQAIQEGADIVIGPLNKQSVAQFARAGEIDIPVLSLNQVQPEVLPPTDLFQFGLAPEDEARQVAERAWLDGHTTAVVLIPENNWGNRILEAFREHWGALGGILPEHQTYNPAENDFSTPIKSLLNLDESEARRQALQGKLGKKLEFEPRRRQDADFIFLAAKARIARQIRPQLQFHHAADLPVYTTSHVYTGNPSADRDIDLEGVKFPDIPWILVEEDESIPLSRRALTRTLGLDQTPFLRLYAMGIDSYLLLPHLGRLQSNPGEALEGKTGNLYMDQINQIRRQLVWAQITGGIPDVIGFTPRLDDPLTTPAERIQGSSSSPEATLKQMPEVQDLSETPEPEEATQ
ncbi:MAG: penicillin-binding protein activator [Gammaproteobacteria bacterium]|nr:penicillin-binding protein activator [Gammaproteobacteria bacterium]